MLTAQHAHMPSIKKIRRRPQEGARREAPGSDVRRRHNLTAGRNLQRPWAFFCLFNIRMHKIITVNHIQAFVLSEIPVQLG